MPLEVGLQAGLRIRRGLLSHYFFRSQLRYSSKLSRWFYAANDDVVYAAYPQPLPSTLVHSEKQREILLDLRKRHQWEFPLLDKRRGGGAFFADVRD